MKKISIMAFMALICYFGQAQNLGIELKELKEAIANGNSGDIENKHGFDFWFEGGDGEYSTDEAVVSILSPYDKLDEQFADVQSKMIDKLLQPVPPNSKDKFHV